MNANLAKAAGVGALGRLLLGFDTAVISVFPTRVRAKGQAEVPPTGS